MKYVILIAAFFLLFCSCEKGQGEVIPNPALTRQQEIEFRLKEDIKWARTCDSLGIKIRNLKDLGPLTKVREY